jgi:hypothetical protein
VERLDWYEWSLGQRDYKIHSSEMKWRANMPCKCNKFVF